jgi:hypothetical protein
MFSQFNRSKVVSLLLIVAVLMALSAAAVSAQTAVPTEVPPVSIEIDTDQLFTGTNNWINTFLPVFALTGGIAIALVLLSFVVRKVVDSFKSAGG